MGCFDRTSDKDNLAVEAGSGSSRGLWEEDWAILSLSYVIQCFTFNPKEEVNIGVNFGVLK